MRRTLVVLGLTLLLVACSDDDGDTTDEDTNDADLIEVTYEMGEDLSDGEVEQLVQIVENRLEALGVEDPSVVVDGTTVRVELPDLDAAQRNQVAELVGTTAELRFRPVLLHVPLPDGGESPVAPTPREDDAATETVVLDEPDHARYQLGPTEATGSIVEDATAELSPEGAWQVALVLTEDGIGGFNAMARRCSPPSSSCPTGQIAIVLDSVVFSAPTVQTDAFERDAIVISADFTEQEAKDLATVLRYGSLPGPLRLVEDG